LDFSMTSSRRLALCWRDGPQSASSEKWNGQAYVSPRVKAKNAKGAFLPQIGPRKISN
jgi:hypothetical protein